jgi:DnaJ family protein A protein 2
MFGGFPFGGFGGFEEMGGGKRGGPPKEVENKKYYELLGVDPKASMDDIKKSFRTLALKHHPDRGGDKEKFQELQMAYEVLIDKEKRDIYDKHGAEGLKDGGARAGGMDDILSQMFGMGGGRQQQGPKKMKSM